MIAPIVLPLSLYVVCGDLEISLTNKAKRDGTRIPIMQIDDSGCEINVVQDDVEKNNDREVTRRLCHLEHRKILRTVSSELSSSFILVLSQVTLVSLEVCATTSNQKAMRVER